MYSLFTPLVKVTFAKQLSWNEWLLISEGGVGVDTLSIFSVTPTLSWHLTHSIKAHLSVYYKLLKANVSLLHLYYLILKGGMGERAA